MIDFSKLKFPEPTPTETAIGKFPHVDHYCWKAKPSGHPTRKEWIIGGGADHPGCVIFWKHPTMPHAVGNVYEDITPKQLALLRREDRNPPALPDGTFHTEMVEGWALPYIRPFVKAVPEGRTPTVGYF